MSRIRRTSMMLVLALVLVFTALPTAAMAAPSASHDHGYGHGGNIHVVRKGQSLSGIARYYGVTVQALAKENGLAINEWVYVGQKLRIPPAGTGHKKHEDSKPVGCVKYHHVKKGDTLSEIAKWYKVNLKALAALNNIGDANVIRIGSKICIPSAYQGVNYDNDHHGKHGKWGKHG
jgi:LysM repeat protein